MTPFLETWIPGASWDQGQQLWVKGHVPVMAPDMSVPPLVIKPTFLEPGHNFVETGGIWQPPPSMPEYFQYHLSSAFGVPPGMLGGVDPPLEPFVTPDNELAELVPALKSYARPCPAVRDQIHQATVPPGERCGCIDPMLLKHLIQHLNDTHEWPREQIADWLDTLDVDLTFQPANKGD